MTPDQLTHDYRNHYLQILQAYDDTFTLINTAHDFRRGFFAAFLLTCLLYTSPSPRDRS